MGGEKWIICCCSVRCLGSPPRGRGKGGPQGPGLGPHRITPAWAGKSREIPLHLRAAKDHPRMGGEKPICRSVGCPASGSPPHGRGKVLPCPALPYVSRITPAWAGKSRSILEFVLASQDHPHTCGEKTFIGLVLKHQIGSPPHGRGKVRQVGGFDGVAGITPTRAGKRARCPCWCAGGQDHPRVGGEKREWRPTRREKSGSSPRGRGKDPHPDVQGIVRGITPAWAGKRPGVKGALPPFRITPAWAGKSCCGTGCSAGRKDHPRVGGEKPIVIPCRLASRGSPPHGRGKV